MCCKILVIRFNCGCCIKTDGMPLFVDPCELSRWWTPASGIPSDYLDLCIFHPKEPHRVVQRTLLDLSMGNHGYRVGCNFHLMNKEYPSWTEWLKASASDFVLNEDFERFTHLFGFERRHNGEYAQRAYTYLKIGYTKDVMLNGTIIQRGEACIPILGLGPPRSQAMVQRGPFSDMGSAYHMHGVE